MFWKITSQQSDNNHEFTHPDGRFVLHRHHDADGPHLDLRIECGDCLTGWRIDGADFNNEPWAVEKRPHPVHWLERDGDAVREDAGVYLWLTRGRNQARLLLRGKEGDRIVRLDREPGLSAQAVREIVGVLREHHYAADAAAQLISDGIAARQRAVERLCGLGRELDGGAFDSEVWRRTLDSMTLDEIHAQLRAFEVRFDQKYPPRPVSRPERLPDEASGERTDTALAIARE